MVFLLLLKSNVMMDYEFLEMAVIVIANLKLMQFAMPE